MTRTNVKKERQVLRIHAIDHLTAQVRLSHQRGARGASDERRTAHDCAIYDFANCKACWICLLLNLLFTTKVGLPSSVLHWLIRHRGPIRPLSSHQLIGAGPT